MKKKTELRIVFIFLFIISFWPSHVFGADIYAVHYPPYMIEDGKNPGFAIEVILEADKRIGEKSTIQFLPFVRMLATLQANKNGLFPTLYRNPQKEENFSWVAMVWSIEEGFMSIDKPVNSLDEARKLDRIGVVQQTALYQFLKAEGFSNLETVNRPQLNAKKLATGRIDAWFLTTFLARQLWENENFSTPLIIGKTVLTEKAFIVTNKSFPSEIAQKYKTVIDSMHKDGTIKKIIQKYGLDINADRVIYYP